MKTEFNNSTIRGLEELLEEGAASKNSSNQEIRKYRTLMMLEQRITNFRNKEAQKNKIQHQVQKHPVPFTPVTPVQG
jgi:CII-binding regulator of phage lambda lysogenization HflD